MATLILSTEGLLLKEIRLDRERLCIGRKPLNQIQINNQAIADEHALIVTRCNESIVEDLNSPQGTHVNGLPVKRHLLRHNDVMALGRYEFKYMEEPAGSPGTAAPVDMVSELAAIRILNGANGGKELLLSKPVTSLGKAGGQVAVIKRQSSAYFITHVEGDAFPLVNGRMLDASPHRLEDHDVIEISGVRMEFFLKS